MKGPRDPLYVYIFYHTKGIFKHLETENILLLVFNHHTLLNSRKYDIEIHKLFLKLKIKTDKTEKATN